MRRFYPAILVLVVSCQGTTDDVLVTIQDPHGIAAAATAVFVGERLDTLEPRDLNSLSFNVTIPVRNSGTRNPRELWVEARDVSGIVLARGVTTIDFEVDDRVELDLRAICDTNQRCPAPVDTFICCEGSDVCVDELAECPPGSSPKVPGFALSFSPPQSAIASSFNVAPSGGSDDGLTLEAWVFVESCVGDCQGTLFAKGGFWSMKLESSGQKLGFEVRITTDRRANPSAGTIDLGAWHHLAATYDGSVVQLFVDGVGVGSSPLTGRLDRGTDPIRFGHPELSFVLDDVRVWNQARSPAQILSAKDRRLEGTEQGLVAYWPFDDGAGQVATDLAGDHDVILGEVPMPDAADPNWRARDL